MSTSEPTTLYLIAATVLDRRAYRTLLRMDAGRDAAVESDFAPVSIWAAMRGKPDLALIVADRASPEIRDAVQMIPRLRKSTRVVVAGSTLEPSSLLSWADCGLSGYVYRDGEPADLRACLDAVAAGGTWFSEGAQAIIGAGRRSGAGERGSLSRRESELLPLLASGLTLREAASRMTVSYKTADSYRTSLLRKLGIRDRVELVRYAIRERIVDP